MCPEITTCSKADFDQIVSDVVAFWGSDRTLHLHQAYLVYEFGTSAYVIKEAGQVIAYLFGFISQTEPVGYVHLLAVRDSHRGRGLARQLYDHFAGFARAAGCREIKAITTATNSASIAFHRGVGMELLGTPNEEGVPVVKDYGGPGKDRVVFRKRI
jgi:GNAT superfamily N-acetyltransferase